MSQFGDFAIAGFGGRSAGQLTFVGAKTADIAGFTSGTTAVSLSGLSGGTDSSPQAGDLVLVCYVVVAGSDISLDISDGASGYALVGSELYSADSVGTNLRVERKFMGGTPDIEVLVSPTTSANFAGSVAISVWRGADPSTPLDVTPTSATGGNTGRPSPASITPTTTGAVAVVFGGGGKPTGGGLAVYTSSDLSAFQSNALAETLSYSLIGVGHLAWAGGAMSFATWGGGVTDSTASWAALTVALRPAT